MQDLIEKNIDGLSVRGFMVGCRLKKKSPLQSSYWIVAAGYSWGFELEQGTAVTFSNTLSEWKAQYYHQPSNCDFLKN